MRAAKCDAKQAASLPPVEALMDREFGAIDGAAVPDSFRQGIDGAMREAQLLARPWGFDLSNIAVRS